MYWEFFVRCSYYIEYVYTSAKTCWLSENLTQLKSEPKTYGLIVFNIFTNKNNPQRMLIDSLTLV